MSKIEKGPNFSLFLVNLFQILPTCVENEIIEAEGKTIFSQSHGPQATFNGPHKSPDAVCTLLRLQFVLVVTYAFVALFLTTDHC